MRRRIVLVATAGAVLIGLPTAVLMWDDLWRLAQETMLFRIAEVGLHSIQFVALAGFMALVTWLCSVGWGQAAGWKPRLARGTAISLALGAALPGAWIYWQLLWYAPFPQVTAGPENHYDRLVVIAKHMTPYRYSHGPPLPTTIVAELDEAVQLPREHNQVPQHVIESRWDPDTGLSGTDMMALTGRIWQAADDAAKRGEIDLAADYDVAIIRFDAMAGQGEQGHFAHQGYQLLTLYRRDFSPAKARDIIRLLRQTLSERYDVEFLVACRRAQWDRLEGWHPKLRSALARFGGKPVYNSSAEAAQIREARKTWDTQNLLLQTDLAIGEFRSDRGHLPASLSELVPEYLPELPIDPYSGAALAFQPVGTQFTLYSVGRNGTDDSGRGHFYTFLPAETGDDVHLGPPAKGKR
jgi:hypothetical protein